MHFRHIISDVTWGYRVFGSFNTTPVQATQPGMISSASVCVVHGSPLLILNHLHALSAASVICWRLFQCAAPLFPRPWVPCGVTGKQSLCSWSRQDLPPARTTFFIVSDTRTWSGLSVVIVMVSGNLSCLPLLCCYQEPPCLTGALLYLLTSLVLWNPTNYYLLISPDKGDGRFCWLVLPSGWNSNT